MLPEREPVITDKGPAPCFCPGRHPDRPLRMITGRRDTVFSMLPVKTIGQHVAVIPNQLQVECFKSVIMQPPVIVVGKPILSPFSSHPSISPVDSTSKIVLNPDGLVQ